AKFLAQLPESDRLIASDDELETRLAMSIRLDQMFLMVAYGLTNSLDVSLALSLNRIAMSANADAFIRDPAGNGGASFARDQRGVCPDFRRAHDQVDATAFRPRAVFLRPN